MKSPGANLGTAPVQKFVEIVRTVVTEPWVVEEATALAESLGKVPVVAGDKAGFIANAPMVWGPQPYKGNIFFSDWNTGLWCVKLVQENADEKDSK